MVQNDECIPVGEHYVICRNKEAYKSPAINLIRNLSLLENMITIPYFGEHYKKIPIRIHLSHNFIANKKQFPNGSEYINISTGCMDAIWCFSRFLFYYYDYHSEGHKKDHPKEEEENAIDYYLRRLCFLIISNYDPCKGILDYLNSWPSTVPVPVILDRKLTQDNTEALSSELTLHAIAFILMHECAHSYLQHKESTISAEYEADNLAIEALFDEKEDQEKKWKILLGVIIAMVIPFFFFLNNARQKGTSHPSPLERLNKIFSKYSNVLSSAPEQYDPSQDSMDMRPIIGYANSIFYQWGQIWPKAVLVAEEEIYKMRDGNPEASREETLFDKKLLKTCKQITELAASRKFINPIDSYHELVKLLSTHISEDKLV